MFDERGLFTLDYEGMLERGDLTKEDTVDNDPNKRKVVVANTLELHDKQAQFVEAVSSGEYRYMMFGGAIQGGKTTVALTTLFLLCKIYPGSRWAVVRKDLPTLKRNTLPSFNRIRPVGFVGEMSRGDWVARCNNGSEIFFFPESLSEDPDYDRWKGLLVNGFLLEEANELARKTFDKAMERAGSWKVPGPEQPNPLILCTCNPAKNWVLNDFYLPFTRGTLKPPYYFLPSLPDDNPHLNPEYRKSLENLPEKERSRFVYGNWTVEDEPSQLVSYESVLNAMKSVEPVPGKRSLAVDVARYGDDSTVFATRVGNALVALEYFDKQGTNVTAARVHALINSPEQPIDADNVRVDVVGLGAGVVDWLADRHVRVVEVVSGASPKRREGSLFRFKNLRSQMWWEFREALRRGEVAIEIDDPRLIEDLTAPRYRIDDKVITVEAKDDIKKRIGRSTDAADAVVYAFANLKDDSQDTAGVVLPGEDTINPWSIP